MIEKDQGSDRKSDKPLVDDHHDLAAVEMHSVLPKRPDPEVTEAARHARFRAVVDNVMKDHHAVLAALAK